MQLLKQPRTAQPHVFIQVASPTIPAAWAQYLAPRKRRRQAPRSARRLGAS